jgi:SprT protein
VNNSVAFEIVKNCLDQAKNLFPFIATTPEISFSLTGTAAGKCEYQFSRNGKLKACRLNFNATAIQLNKDLFIHDTVPHEVAHFVVAQRFGNKVKPHGAEWRSICKALGGSGQRTHNLKLENRREQRRWLYRDSLGAIHQLSTIRHRRLQQGTTYRTLSSNALISRHGFISLYQAEKS